VCPAYCQCTYTPLYSILDPSVYGRISIVLQCTWIPGWLLVVPHILSCYLHESSTFPSVCWLFSRPAFFVVWSRWSCLVSGIPVCLHHFNVVESYRCNPWLPSGSIHSTPLSSSRTSLLARGWPIVVPPCIWKMLTKDSRELNKSWRVNKLGKL